jgi:DNA-directed RNA polymerase specialized sigma24 family protein
LDIHAGLDKLTEHDAAAAELVKLHYFGGLSIDEAADLLGINRRRAFRQWSYARAWLYRHLGAERAGEKK